MAFAVRKLEQPFGKRSRQSLADLCAVKRARVIWNEQDRNGRLLARVWCSGIDANAEQVRRGMKLYVCAAVSTEKRGRFAPRR